MSNVIYKLEIKIWMINLWDFSTRAKEIRILIKFHCSRDIYKPLRILTFNKKKINFFGNTEVINNIYTCKTCILISRCQKKRNLVLVSQVDPFHPTWHPFSHFPVTLSHFPGTPQFVLHFCSQFIPYTP